MFVYKVNLSKLCRNSQVRFHPKIEGGNCAKKVKPIIGLLMNNNNRRLGLK